MSCTITDFTAILAELNTAWATLWPSVNYKVPTAAGLSFGAASSGTCYGICGSLGITACNGFQYLIPDTAAATLAWSTCGPVDAAVISVPLPAVPMNYQVQGRATGLGALWPGGPGAEAFSMTGQAFALVLITVPIANTGPTGTLANYRDFAVDLKFYFTIDSAWPDTSNELFLAVPTGNLALTYAADVNARMSFVAGALKKAMQIAGQALTCAPPVIVDQTCALGTSMPGAPCNPCDKCCTCLIQQKCDGTCADCPCVGCNLWTESLAKSASWVLFMFFFIIFLVSWAIGFTEPSTKATRATK